MHNVDAEFDRWPAADWPSRGWGGGVQRCVCVCVCEPSISSSMDDWLTDPHHHQTPKDLQSKIDGGGPRCCRIIWAHRLLHSLCSHQGTDKEMKPKNLSVWFCHAEIIFILQKNHTNGPHSAPYRLKRTLQINNNALMVELQGVDCILYI